MSIQGVSTEGAALDRDAADVLSFLVDIDVVHVTLVGYAVVAINFLAIAERAGSLVLLSLADFDFHPGFFLHGFQ